MAQSEDEDEVVVPDELSENSLEDSLAYGNPIPLTPVRSKKIEATPEPKNEELSVESESTLTSDLPNADTGSYSDTDSETYLNQNTDRDQISINSGIRSQSTSNRELSIQSLVHLMGLPTAVQVGVLDTKLDLVTAKLGTIQSKIDRIQSQLDLITVQSPLDRIEFQLTEVRSIMKKFFPTAFQSSGSGAGFKQEARSKPQVLSNKDGKKETSVHVGAKQECQEVEEPLTDADYQAIEAMKMRSKAAEPRK